MEGNLEGSSDGRHFDAKGRRNSMELDARLAGIRLEASQGDRYCHTTA